MKFFWLIGGNLIYALSQWIILLIFSRNFLKDDVGQYFFALSLIAPLALITSLKLPNLLLTFSQNEGEDKFLFSFRIILSLILFILTIFIYFVFFNENVAFFVLLMVLLYKILEQSDDLVIALYQKKMNFRKIFFLKFFRSLVYCVLVYVGVLIFENIVDVLLFSTLVYFLYWWCLNRKFIYILRLDYYKIKKYFKNGIYLSLSSALSSLNVSGSRLFVGYFLGNSFLAVYGVISYSLVAFSIIISAISQYFLPLFVKYRNTNFFYKKIYFSQFLVFSISLFFMIFSYFYGDFLLSIFYGKEYSEYGFFLFMVFFANLFKSSSSLIGTAMTSLKVYNFQLSFTLISLFVSILITPLMIVKYSLLGAFYAILIVNFFEWVLYMFFAKRSFNKILNM